MEPPAAPPSSPVAAPLPTAKPAAPEPDSPKRSYVSTAFSFASEAADFFFGESKTDAERVTEKTHQVRRAARRTEHEAWLAEQKADASIAKQEAIVASEAFRTRAMAGRHDPALKREILRGKREDARAQRLTKISESLANAADGVGETAAQVRIAEAASVAADTLEEANHMIAEAGDGESIAEKIEREQDRMLDHQQVFSRALGGTTYDQVERSAEADYRKMVARYRPAPGPPVTLPTPKTVETGETRSALASTVSQDSEMEALLQRVTKLKD